MKLKELIKAEYSNRLEELKKQLNNKEAKIEELESRQELIGDVKTYNPADVDNETLFNDHRTTHAWWEIAHTDQSPTHTKEDTLRIHVAIVKELFKRKLSHEHEDGLDEASIEFLDVPIEFELAPLPNKRHEEPKRIRNNRGAKIKLSKILPHFKESFKMNTPTVLLAGNLVEKGETHGDIDILIRKPEPKYQDDDISLKMKILKMFPEELWERVYFNYDMDAEPSDKAIPLFDQVYELYPKLKKVQLKKDEEDSQFSKDKLKNYPAINIRAPLGRAIFQNKKKRIIRPELRKEYMRKPLYVASGNEILGIIVLMEPEKIDSEQFKSSEKLHGLSEEDKIKLWGENNEFYSYPFRILRSYDPPKYYKLEANTRSFMDTVEFIEQEEKLDDPYLNVPSEETVFRFVMQNHFIGKEAHKDFRIEVNNEVIGWSILDQIEGKITEDVTSKPQAVTFSDMAIWKFTKDSIDKHIMATQSETQPIEYLNLEEPIKDGYMHIIDKGSVQFGVQQPDFHEYFIYGKKYRGRLLFRQLKTKKGDLVWLAWLTDKQDPTILSEKAILESTISAKGISSLPGEVRDKIPPKFHYWNEESRLDRIRLRNALVEAMKQDDIVIKFKRKLPEIQKKPGRSLKLNDDEIEMLKKMTKGNVSRPDIARNLGISKSTVYLYQKKFGCL